MHIHALRIKNFRRLRDVQIDLNSDISIFVGANNSGKGSVALSAKMHISDELACHPFKLGACRIGKSAREVLRKNFNCVSLKLFQYI